MNEDLMTEPGIPVRRYREIFMAGWYWIVAGAMSGVVGAFAFMQTLTFQATATTVVNIEVISTNPFGLDRAASNFLDISTEVALAKSWQTAVLASERLNGELEPSQIREGTEVTAEATGTILRIAFTDPNQARAEEVADGVAAAYLDIRRSNAQVRATESAAAIDERLAQLSEELAVALEVLANTEAGTTEAAAADTDRQLITQEIESLVSERARLYHVAGTAGQIITPAGSNEVYFSPSRVVILAGGLMLGGVIGVALVFGADRWRRRITSAEELTSLTGIPVWRAEPHAPDEWRAAREMVRLASEGIARLGVVYPSDSDAAQAFVQTFSEAVESTVIDIPAAQGMGDVLAGVHDVDAVVLFLRKGAHRRTTVQLISVLEGINRPAIGAVFISRPWPNSTDEPPGGDMSVPLPKMQDRREGRRRLSELAVSRHSHGLITGWAKH